MQNNQRYVSVVREEADLTTRIAYLVVGGTIGAALALLFAPKSGRELRGDIADVTRKGVERAGETATQVGAKAGEYYEVARERAGELYGTASTKAGEITGVARELAARSGEQFSAAIEAGRQAYSEEKQRTADDQRNGQREGQSALEPGQNLYEGGERLS